MSKILLFLGLVTLATLTLTAGADVLVTKDGERIETKGPWKVKGRMVQFHSASGTLQSIRLSEVDLEASEAATEAEASAADDDASSPQRLQPYTQSSQQTAPSRPESRPTLPIRKKGEAQRPALVINNETLEGGPRPGLVELILSYQRYEKERQRAWPSELDQVVDHIRELAAGFPSLQRYPKRPEDLAAMQPSIDALSKLIPIDDTMPREKFNFYLGVQLELINLINDRKKADWATRSHEKIERYWEKLRAR